MRAGLSLRSPWGTFFSEMSRYTSSSSSIRAWLPACWSPIQASRLRTARATWLGSQPASGIDGPAARPLLLATGCCGFADGVAACLGAAAACLAFCFFLPLAGGAGMAADASQRR
jgi:hypothetical protein